MQCMQSQSDLKSPGLNESSSIGHCTLDADKLYKEGYYLKAADAYKEFIHSYGAKDQSSLSAVYQKLGKTLLEGLETKEALTAFFKALELKEKSEDIDYRGIAEIRLMIGEAYLVDAEYSEVEKYLEESRVILVENYGEDHPDMCIYYNRLGALNWGQGRYLDCLTNFQKSINISSVCNPPNKIEMSMSYNLLSSVHQDLGDYTQASNCAVISLKTKTEIYGQDHPMIAICFTRIGLLCQNQSKYQEALRNHYKALELRKKFFGKYHPSSGDSYNNIGLIQDLLGDDSSALESYQKCLEIDIASGKENHPNCATTHCNIGSAYVRKNNLEKALWHYNKALEIRVHAYGEGHPYLGDVYDGIANIHRMKYEYNEAEENYLKALDIKLKSFGDRNSDVAASYNNFGNLYFDQNEYPKAAKNYLKSLKIKSSLEDEHGAADCFLNLNLVFQDVKDKSLAKACVIKAYQGYSKVFGSYDHNSRNSMRQLKELEKKKSMLNINSELKF